MERKGATRQCLGGLNSRTRRGERQGSREGKPLSMSPVCSAHLCSLWETERTHSYEITHKQLAGEVFLSQRVFLFLTELTDLTEHFAHSLIRGEFFSLTELTDLTEPICALFRTHRTPPAYRIHRAFKLKGAVTFCEFGWLNVSVGLCVFCSSVFFCEK